MICSSCNTINDGDNVFCVNCGNAVSGGPASPSRPASAVDSAETQVVNYGRNPTPAAAFSPPHGADARDSRRSSMPIVIGGLVVVMLLVGGVAAFMVYRSTPSEKLPDHLGMFVQNDAKDRVDEIRKQDVTNALDAKTTLLKDESLPTLAPQPNLILHADTKEINVTDLSLVQLDSIRDDGSMMQIDFQAAPVDGKPEMKRLRTIEPLANGKYAFALLEGYLNEGKHKFWAFQVRNSSKSENGSLLKANTFPVKPRSSEPPAGQNAPRAQLPPPVLAPPPGTRVAYTRTGGVLLRNGPGTGAAVRAKLGNGQPVYVFSTTGWDCFTGKQGNYGCGPWAQVQTTSGTNGYILSVLLR